MLKIYRPTTPSRRAMSVIPYRTLLTPHAPWKPLLVTKKDSAGRNARGVITVRHQGGGNKKRYRIVDFRQEKKDVPARVETIEYDPYRSAFISRILYRDGERRYILAPNGIRAGAEITVSERAPLTPGNRLPLGRIPVGAQVYNIELRPGSGGRMARSAGAYAEVLAHEGDISQLRLNSKEIRRVRSSCWASMGQVSNPDYNLVRIGKAGRNRWLGIRPTVRGGAMNPVDHPYGGGEGRQPRGTKRPKTIWGKVTGGRKTRNRKKWSAQYIIQRRPKIR